jgi:3-deoxy-D-manno-octulosonic-acid transferase
VPRVLRFLTDWPLHFYNLALLVCAPIILALKLWRYFKKGWKREYDFARWTIPIVNSLPASSAPRIVLVGTGWGEMRLLELLDGALKVSQPNLQMMWVLRDRDAITQVQKEHPAQSVTWLPFDFCLPVWIWLWKVRPDVVVFTEKFWFPNLVRGCKNRGARLMVMNARTRSHESARYQLFAFWQRRIAGSFDAIVFQSAEDLERARTVLSPHTQMLAPGNLKFALRPVPDESKTQSLERWLGGASTPLLAAGSLEDGDLEFVLDAFDIVREKQPCHLLVAPRRLHLAGAMGEEIRACGYTLSLRSQESTLPADVYFLDTLGELAAAYEFCTAVFIGGTLKSGTGHNVVEPLVFGIAVSYGLNRGFFESVQIACETEGVGFRVAASGELAAHWMEMLENPALREEVSTRAAKLLSEQNAALEVTISALLELVKLAAARRR